MQHYLHFSEEELALLCLALKDDRTPEAQAELVLLFRYADEHFPDFTGTMERLQNRTDGNS